MIGYQTESYTAPISANGFRTGSLGAEKFVFVLLNVLDIFLTIILIRTGSFYEANPIANYILENWSYAGMALYKLVLIFNVIIIANIIGIWRIETSRKLLYAGIAIMACVVIYSSCLIARFHGII